MLLDEPTASLDPDTADWVRAHLERYCRDRRATVLLASHNMLEVERLCERVIIMKRGRIEDDDTPARLLARYGRRTLEEVFLDVARGRDEGRGRAMSHVRHRKRVRVFAAARGGDDAALLVSVALVLAAAARADLLAALQMITWGFIQYYVMQNAGFFARAGGTLIGAVLLWDILFRGQLGFSISFLEEMWARNIGNLMMSPVAADRVRHRADGHEHRAAGDRRRAGDAARYHLFRLQPLWARASRWSCFSSI